MAIVLRRNSGTALTFDQLDDNFVDYTTFRDKFDQTQWTGSSDGYFLYFDNPTGKIKVKALAAGDLSAGFGANFTSALATKTTDNLSEGSANLYYTSARANADFDTRIATKSTTNLSEGSNKYYTDARVDARIGASNTDSLSEGSSNQYFTNARADARIANATLQTLSNVETPTSAQDGYLLKYNHSTSGYVWQANPLTNTDSFTEGSSNLFFTTARADARVNLQTGTNLDISSKDTDNLSEGSSNLYFTTARARASISASGNLAYNSSTGALTYTQGNTDTVTEGSSNLYYTNARADARIALANLQDLANVLSPAGPGDNGKLLMYRNDGGTLNRFQLVQFSDTDQLPEGSTNLYYTDARVDTRIASGNAPRFKLPSYTTTARNGLGGVQNGELIYNTTVNKIQGYENGSWKDLSTVYG
tara:strand:+ start:567 stop:1826 length:1260 start_codon:yes stop_codon:yes gene_type:complete